MTLKQQLNGKKTLIGLIVTVAIGYGTLQADVKHNKVEVTELKKTPVKIEGIEQKIIALKDDVGEIKRVQETLRTEQGVIREDIGEIKGGIQILLGR